MHQFQYSHISSYAVQVTRLWKIDRRKRHALEQSLHAERQQWQKTQADLSKQIAKLEKDQAKLKKWEQRKAMINHINRLFHPKVPVDTEHILFGAGVTCILEELGFTIASEGDAVLYSSPIYQSFKYDFLTKARYVSTFPANVHQYAILSPFSVSASDANRGLIFG